MRVLKYLFVLSLLLNIFNYAAAQVCMKLQYVTRTRAQWNNGQRRVSKLGFFGNTKYKYEPYMYSTIQYYGDYERVQVCCEGYTKVSDTICEPICKPSCPTNTRCMRPNICECTEGYVGYNTHPTLMKCHPVCAPACPENSYCSQPRTCSCNEGYEKTANGSCDPVCEHECPVNSQCIRPNECGCTKGYSPGRPMFPGHNPVLICEPQCNVPCPLNSVCAEPDKCSCLPGHAMLDNQCEAICDPTCPENGFCKKPNQCECLEGYELGKTEDGFLECIPKCNEECSENGFCSEPNVCACNTGYEKSSNTTCEPICQPKCGENAQCSAPNSCSCLKGYQMIDNRCQPTCDNPCPEHSQCVKPNKCQCLGGYQLKLSSLHTIYCEPQCQRNCSTFGKCVQPNKCECLEGYEMDELEDCKPICSEGCMNGLCYRPDVCICHAGYLMGPHNQCEPTCSMPCQNGSCVEPEICECSEGYRLKPGTVNICEPQCEPECVNGVCVDANVCICLDHYGPLEEDGSYNHSYCQRIETTTSPVYTTEAELTSPEPRETTFTTALLSDEETTEPTPASILENTPFTTTSTSPLFSEAETSESTTTSIPENISFTTTSLPWASSQVCPDLCQCWQEYDELGSISTDPQCIHPCLDPYDKPCLNFNLCRCAVSSVQLFCQSEDDLEEEPFVYVCKIPKPIQTTTIKSVEMKSTADAKDSSYHWIILAAIIGACALAVLGISVYRKYFRHEDTIVEYEL